ncbi:hypothetical protein, partial [Bacillus cereus]|uniref:hypothetical protein n=1 Tax=Bacillus cereus TaxID=1396 RepID=UPI000534EC77
MLASSEYIPFKKVKPKLLSFIVISNTEYHKVSKYLTELSQNKRTEEVHNAKNLYGLYNSLDEIKRELFYIIGLIIRYVQKVIELDIKSLEKLENECERLKK